MGYFKLKPFAIDFEYFFDDNRNLVPLCVAMNDGNKTHSWWLLDTKQRSNFIATVNKFKKTGLFVAHAIEPAEGRCFYMLGLNPTEFNWRDTFLESVIVNNTNRKKKPANNLVAVTKRFLKIDIDAQNKECIRDLIINRQYEGNEQKILDYCESDVHYILPLADQLAKAYSKKLVRAKMIHGVKPTPSDALLSIGRTAAQYAVIGCRGIPLNSKYVSLLLDNAKECLASVQMEFNKTHEIYDVKPNKITRKTHMLQSKLQEFASSKGIEWTKTKTGRLSTAEVVLKEWKGSNEFPDVLRTHGKTCRVLSSFCKVGDRNWLHNYNNLTSKISPSLFPYGTQTGRCAAKPKSGFIYTWGKQFRGLINPPEGYSLIEVDYGSQEVCISADWSKDTAMLDSYHTNDYYLAFMQKCGRFPKDLPLPTEEERSLPLYLPYKEVRNLSKSCCLGLSYGMGEKKLATNMSTTVKIAREYKNNFEKVYRVYTKKRRDFKDKVSIREGINLAFPDGFIYEVFSPDYDTRSINSLLNLPIQGLGSVMLRHVVNLCFERGLYLIATIHDAVVIMCREEEREQKAKELQEVMLLASELTLGTTHMKVGAPEYTLHNQPNTHGADKQWSELLFLLENAQNTREPDSEDLFDESE